MSYRVGELLAQADAVADRCMGRLWFAYTFSIMKITDGAAHHGEDGTGAPVQTIDIKTHGEGERYQKLLLLTVVRRNRFLSVCTLAAMGGCRSTRRSVVRGRHRPGVLVQVDAQTRVINRGPARLPPTWRVSLEIRHRRDVTIACQPRVASRLFLDRA